MGNLRYNNEPQLLMIAEKKVILPFNMMTNGNSLRHGYQWTFPSKRRLFSELQKLLELAFCISVVGELFFIREKSGNFEKGSVASLNSTVRSQS